VQVRRAARVVQELDWRLGGDDHGCISKWPTG
jgi:hypothetical protein